MKQVDIYPVGAHPTIRLSKIKESGGNVVVYVVTKMQKTLSHLPFYEPIIEDEQHVIATCPCYHHIRLQLNNKLKEAVVSWDKQKLKELFNEENVDNFSKYIQKIFSIRFPKTQELH